MRQCLKWIPKQIYKNARLMSFFLGQLKNNQVVMLEVWSKSRFYFKCELRVEERRNRHARILLTLIVENKGK